MCLYYFYALFLPWMMVVVVSAESLHCSVYFVICLWPFLLGSRLPMVSNSWPLASIFCKKRILTFRVGFPDDVQTPLRVNISHSGVLYAPLGQAIIIPCSASSSPLTLPRVKWTLMSGRTETQILVAQGGRVKVNETYRGRADLLNYRSSPEDLSLRLLETRSSDSGHYRCEVQQGLQDTSDIVQLKVKGNEKTVVGNVFL